MDLIKGIRKLISEQKLMFVYRGIVTHENSMPLLMLLEKEMENSQFGFLGRKRLFMFVLESLQNVSRHGAEKEHPNMSLVVYSKDNGGYTVSTGNVIPSENTADLKKRLEEINRLENTEIRKVYRQMLTTSELSTKGGAGLGLIEMAKKTGNKLDFDFVGLDEKSSYFILSKTVDSKGVGVHAGVQEKPFQGKEVAQLERIMAENDIFFLWSGHITPDVGKEVISFHEAKLSEDEIESNLRKRVFSILIEIIENVAKYSPGNEAEKKYGMPVAIIRYSAGTYYLTTFNLIPNENVDGLKEKIDRINELDRESLREFYVSSLSGQSSSSENTGNMGLIEMARKSGNKLIYQFERLNDLYSWYLITVAVKE
ncbi:MAG TPA: SiaB family protein kinase [Bacteroidales bacterium]|nr:SiaB family protein kinase [Bacteroidales bacterium]HPF04019.1 SiaB family protein kinase [Bacteroidales bacterium]HPJ59885.1 SiaB family protein kinase [Bacteroidales bacterium]HPR11364.1 SiaB family protein kinase [Bacteroidales bacterium]HRW85737.1 SiaB family protein kinase [Bacteroidales bacterium]